VTGARRRAVITGIGCLAPNGNGREDFGQAIREGRSGIAKVTLFDPEGLPVTIAAELKDFEPSDHLPAREVARLSRAVPMAVAASEEALADARIDWRNMPLDDSRQMNVLLGTGGGAVEFAERMYHLYFTGQQRRASAHTISTGTIGTMSSELSMKFGFRGLSHVVTTGCASSTDALGYAFRAIKHGEGRAFLVGGVDATIVRGIMEGFILMRVVSTAFDDEPARASRPFSADRDGFVLGEGAWMFVVEDLERASGRGVSAYGEILGYGATCDAHHRIRLDETGEEPARAMRLALEEGRVAPEAVDYLSYHGTSTELNDRVETRAVKKAFGPAAGRLAGSSIKSMIGHPQGACGAAGVASTLLAMRDGYLPPTINLERPDPECDLDYVGNAARPRTFSTALCNCIAFGSKNSALLLRKVG
jgi:3-oxoacyl-[acyl-carrier-protein] synthase II